MKSRYGTLLLIGILVIMSQWSCKKSNPVSSATYPTVTISGTVLDWTTGNPIHGAKVVLITGSVKDSCTTDSSGLFYPPFVVEITDSANGVNIKLIVSMTGYNTDSLSILNVKSDQDPTIKLVQSGTTSSTTAVVNGVVNDHASGYPLQGASVVVSLAGTMSSIASMPSAKILQETEVPSVRNKISNKIFSVSKTQTRKESVSAVVLDSTTTLANGTFTLSIPLYGLDSVSTIITVTRSGYLSYQIGKTLKNGTNDLTPISLYVDTSLTRAVVTGIVSDSLSSNPLEGAIVRVALPNGVVDSGSTLVDGSFSIPVNLNGPSAVSATITVVKAGFVTYQLVETLAKGTNDLGTIRLKINVNSTYAIITGTVLDSVSSYPLQGASVSVTLTGTTSPSMVMSSSKGPQPLTKQPAKKLGLTRMTDGAAQSLPGNRASAIVLDSTTTLANGSFAMDVNLYGLNSVTATITVSRTGYKTHQISWTLTPGADSLGNIPLSVGTGANIAVVTGTVVDSASTYPLQGATVLIVLPGWVVDSATTQVDGTFSINVNLLGVNSVNAIVAISYPGYNTHQSTQTLTKGTNGLGNISLSINNSLNYAVVSGIVRDSASSYPIGGATVVVSLPGGPSGSMELMRLSRNTHEKTPSSVVVDSVITQANGSFVLDFNLYDLSSVGAIVTVTKAGYVTYQNNQKLTKGSNSLGNIRMHAVSADANYYAMVTGTVLDSVSKYPLQGVSVQIALPGGVIYDTTTSQNGTFSINVNVLGVSSVSATVTMSYPGYIIYQSIQTLTKGVKSLGDILLPVNLMSTYGVIYGRVRDAVSSYPIGGATVVVSLPGGPSGSMELTRASRKTHAKTPSSVVVDSTTTQPDGSFVVDFNLYDLDSIGVVFSVTDAGYSTYQDSLTVRRGSNSLGNILMNGPTSSFATVTGTVRDSASTYPLQGAMVLVALPGGVIDSARTSQDGTFSINVNLHGLNSVDVTVTVIYPGYVTKTSTQTLTKGLKSLGDIPLAMNINSAYAIMTGVVRDSTTLYPLQGASVVVSLPDTNISTTSSVDGSFALAVNLVNLSSLPVPVTIVKTGFNTYQVVDTLRKGANPLGNILLTISKASGYAEIAGFVKDGKSGLVRTGATVTLTSSVKNDSTVTLSDGSYSFSLNLLGLSSVSGTLAFHLSSYRDTTISFAVNVGQTLSEDVSLTPLPTAIIDSSGRGVARSISLVSVSYQEISIHGVGRNETSVLVWQVLDSLGVPLDISHRDTVTFTPSGPAVSGSDPAYVTPTMGITDGSGQVSATMNSGTVAGTIQLVAKLTLSSGKVVQSSPVLITVDGGLPDQAHFELNPAELNLAGYDWSERTELTPPGFSAQAGDKYGNPVAPGTAIYFGTTGGIITAAGQTDAKGHATATLFSGYPLPHSSGLDSTRFGSASDSLLPLLDRAYDFPNDPTYFGGGTGYAWVKAFTQGEGGVTVADSGLVLFSATTAPILLNGSTNPIMGDTIHSGGSIVIPVHISDRFGNPLESETSITATVKMPPIPSGSSGSWSVDASGLPATLGDNLTRGPGSTDFTLVLTGSEIDISLSAAFGITITVSGRNGSATTSISGTLMP